MRKFIVAGVVLTLLCSAGWARDAQAPPRPNVLFIFSDDHASHAISAYGSKINRTPNIDRIAREGILFRVDLVSFMRPGPTSRALAALAQALGLLFAVVFTLKGYEFAIDTIETTPFLAVSKVPWYAAMPVCGALMVVYAVAGLVRTLSGPVGAQAPSTIPQTRSE